MVMLEKTQRSTKSTRGTQKIKKSLPKAYEEKIKLAQRYGLDKEKLSSRTRRFRNNIIIDMSPVGRHLTTF
jgi:hypothetical protein